MQDARRLFSGVRVFGFVDDIGLGLVVLVFVTYIFLFLWLLLLLWLCLRLLFRLFSFSSCGSSWSDFCVPCPTVPLTCPLAFRALDPTENIWCEVSSHQIFSELWLDADHPAAVLPMCRIRFDCNTCFRRRGQGTAPRPGRAGWNHPTNSRSAPVRWPDAGHWNGKAPHPFWMRGHEEGTGGMVSRSGRNRLRRTKD